MESVTISTRKINPLFSIIIPTCNRPKELYLCIRTLLPQLADSVPVEILVCDDGRSEQVQEAIKTDFPSVGYVPGPQRGPAANRNAGAKTATGRWLVFLDDDCIPSHEFVKSYSNWLNKNDLPVMYAVQGPTIRSSSPKSLLWEAPHNPLGESRISANFMIPKQAFTDSGGFDERFPTPAHEDTEFFNRFECNGGKVFFTTDAIVEHPLRHVPSSRKLASRWEGKVLIALDQGASPVSILYRLPWHVLRVIQSRFSNQPFSFDNLKAGYLFFNEWLIVLFMTPRWTAKWSRQPRSIFWNDYVLRNGPAPKHGL